MNSLNIELNNPLLYTHSDSFHVDELTAIAFLCRFWFNIPVSDLSIIRTRDQEQLKEAKSSANFVIDVGEEFNSSLYNFDHHQSDPSLIWSDSPDKERVPLSSCGLIFNWLMEHSPALNNSHPNIINLLRNLAVDIDKNDNGIKLWELSSQYDQYNRSCGSEEEQYDQFRKALVQMECYLDNIIAQEESYIKGEAAFLLSLEESIQNNHPEYLILTVPFKASRTLSMKTEAVYIATMYENEIAIETVQSDPNDVFSAKRNMPLDWCGLRNTALHNISGHNLKFSHKSGFLTIMLGTSLTELKEVMNSIFNLPPFEKLFK